jgi:hypothetical protein
MKIYKVRTGYKTDFYGYTTNQEEAKYFFNKADAEALYNEGKHIVKETHIITTNANGTTTTATTGATYYERCKANARPNEKVELVAVEYNHYTMEEVEVQ